MKAENKAKRAKASAENKAIHDEERLAKAQEAMAQWKATSSLTTRPALHQVYPAPNHQNVFQPTLHHSAPYYPHPTQFTTAYPYPLVFIPYYPLNS